LADAVSDMLTGRRWIFV